MEQRSKPISRLRSASILCVPTINASSASSALWTWTIQAGSQRSRPTSTYVVFPALFSLVPRRRRGFQEHRRRRLSQSRRDHHSGHPPCMPPCFPPPQPKDLKMHHTAAVDALRAKLKPRLLNAVKGDNSQTLVGFLSNESKISPAVARHLGRHVEHGRVRPALQPRGVGAQLVRSDRRGGRRMHESLPSFASM